MLTPRRFPRDAAFAGGTRFIRAIARMSFVLLALVVAFADDNAPWKLKQIGSWNEDDLRLVLAESPWAKSFTPTLLPSPEPEQRQNGMGSGRGGVGIGADMIGMGVPSVGRRGLGGGGYPNDGSGDYPRAPSRGSMPDLQPVTLRWESATPIRVAELKVPGNNPVSFDDGHYALAVYGLPGRLLSGDAQKLGDRLRKDAALKRKGKKDFKPSSVEVLDQPGGRVVLYLFPRTTEITRQDHRVEFSAKIARLELRQSFLVDDMVWDGKPEL